MSISGIQTVPLAHPSYQNFPSGYPPSAVAQDADLVTVFPEYLGIPFDLFASSSTPPADDPWTIQMKSLAATAKSTGKPIMLETVLTRDVPVAKASRSGGSLVLDSTWAPACMDFTDPQYASVATAYPNYIYWMARTFSPRYFVVMVELNLYYVLCGGDTPSWRKLVDIYQSSYVRAKLANPFVPAFPSFKLEDIYGQTLAGFDQAQMNVLSSVRRDRLGLATYPYGVRLDAVNFANPYQLPADYLTRIRDRDPTEPQIVITETGWNSEPLSLVASGTCYQNYLYSAPSFAAAYMNFLLVSAYIGDFDAIAWWSGRDLINGSAMSTCYPDATPPDYLECGGDIWCKAISAERAYPRPGITPAHSELIFKAFGAMGLRGYDGTPKAGLADTWQRFLALPRK